MNTTSYVVEKFWRKKNQFGEKNNLFLPMDIK